MGFVIIRSSVKTVSAVHTSRDKNDIDFASAISIEMENIYYICVCLTSRLCCLSFDYLYINLESDRGKRNDYSR